MTIAIRQAPVVALKAWAASPNVARIEIFDKLPAAESYWRELERDALMTPYQRFDLLASWQKCIGVLKGIEPLVVVAFDHAGKPLVLFPFGRRSFGALGVVEFLSDEHINFNMGIWRRDFARVASSVEVNAILEKLSTHGDVLALVNQPATWGGARNPLTILPHQPSPSFSHSGKLGPDFDEVLQSRTTNSARKKLRKKAEVLAGHGPVRFLRLQDPEEIRQLLDVFYQQKGTRLRAQGIPSVFDEPCVRAFLLDSATRPVNAPSIELYTLTVGDDIVSIMGGLAGAGRFCAMFNSINPDRFTSASPGDQMLLALARHCCERGFHIFDLGVGEARYKELICNEIDPLFNSYIGLSRAGAILAFALSCAATAKRAVKQNPTLWSLANSARALRRLI